MVRGVRVRLQQRRKPGQSAQLEDGLAEVGLTGHRSDRRNGGRLGEAVGGGEHGDEVGEDGGVLELSLWDGVTRAEVAERDRRIRLELLVGVLQEIQQGREAAILDDRRRLLRVRREL